MAIRRLPCGHWFSRGHGAKDRAFKRRRQPSDSALLGRRLKHTVTRPCPLGDDHVQAGGDEAAAWAPWARLLAGRAAEQRRLEEQFDRLAQQLRDSQRRIDQLSEKLEALKAIERSLGPKRP